MEAGKLPPVSSCQNTKMPIHCPLNIECLSTEQFRSLDYNVTGHAFASQNKIGRRADEQVDRPDLALRLNSAGMLSKEESPIELTHKTFSKTRFSRFLQSGI